MAEASSEFFHRPALAKTLADQALDTSLGLSGGTFLAAPRRTGKSTFVKQDLVPEFRTRGVEVIYADLWIDRLTNPAIHIANAIRQSLARDDGPVASFFKKALGATKLNVGALGSGLAFDLSALGLAKDMTMADALKAVSRASGKKVVLVIDEAQHALTTEDGMNALFSLKAARDSLNSDDDLHGMQLIATGSNRDKLASLVNSRDQAFFGADMVNFPPLGKDFVEWAIGRSKLEVDLDRAFEVFRSGNSRPEGFRRVLAQARIDVAAGSGEAQDVAALLARISQTHLKEARDSFFITIQGLPPLQSVLLRQMAVDARRESRRDGVFSAPMRARLLSALAAEYGPDHGVSADASAVQNALDALRTQGHLWRSQRGSYAFEDEQCVEWLVDPAPIEEQQEPGGNDRIADRPAGG